MLTPDEPARDRAGLAPRRKRALFRAWHRGIREMDLIMGRFADREIATLSDDELDELERLMEEPDQLVYAWITGRSAPPAEFDTPLFARLTRSQG
ncbi:succinate dehydrogenase assembly factor 2 [Enterovirga sp.]|jgi:antitoxin CptB|uniref:FAD assembly factor SdhE n=1 Tax=Enterovirga sp. TaxID=2026350 RepID=UPI002622EC10|nr:succinate dehydrogenase assembly factor 2 [Enterovirga sp.]MDB5592934.1 hypothetical protein [Enterovirga sp.]